METFFTTEEDFKNGSKPLPDNMVIAYVKLVSIGSKTQENCDHMPSEMAEIAKSQDGFLSWR